jgi:hypothetical protein
MVLGIILMNLTQGMSDTPQLKMIPAIAQLARKFLKLTAVINNSSVSWSYE